MAVAEFAGRWENAVFAAVSWAGGTVADAEVGPFASLDRTTSVSWVSRGPEVVVAPLVGKFRSGRCSGHPRAAHRVHDLVPADGTLIPAAWRVPFGLWTV